MKVTTIGLDLAKRVFQLHWVDKRRSIARSWYAAAAERAHQRAQDKRLRSSSLSGICPCHKRTHPMTAIARTP